MATIIYKCQQSGMGKCDGTGWHVQTYHAPTGIQWSEQECPKYASKTEAQASCLGDSGLDRYYGALALGYRGSEALVIARRETR